MQLVVIHRPHLGHTNSKTTFRYINPDPAARARIIAVDELNELALRPEDVPGVH